MTTGIIQPPAAGADDLAAVRARLLQDTAGRHSVVRQRFKAAVGQHQGVAHRVQRDRTRPHQRDRQFGG